MAPSLLQAAGSIAYRVHLGPKPSDVPDHRLVELVAAPDALASGRALDLGCAIGRNALFLAEHGWDTVGVEMVGSALADARRKAGERRLPVTFVQGDVTRLAELDIGENFSLLMDGGCYHMIPPQRRAAYAESVARVAATGARLILVGFRRALGVKDTSPEDLVSKLPGWRLVRMDRVPGDQMHQYVAGPAPLRAALKRGLFHPMRYELERTS